MSSSFRPRRGFSLLEVSIVVVLLGIFFAVASARLGGPSRGNIAAVADARRLAVDLVQAQRRAISSGDNHYLSFTSVGGGVVSDYAVYRRDISGDELVDTVRVFEADVTVTASHTEAEFTFEGAALAAYSFTIDAAARQWQVTVVPVTGAVRMVETTGS